MIILGVLLILIGALVPKVAILTTIGIIFIVCGLALLLLGSSGHPVRGRRNWF